jgi:hypothetical protein
VLRAAPILLSHRSFIFGDLQTYDPTIEDAYYKVLMIDNQMSFIEVINTAGQGELRLRLAVLPINIH